MKLSAVAGADVGDVGASARGDDMGGVFKAERGEGDEGLPELTTGVGESDAEEERPGLVVACRWPGGWKVGVCKCGGG